MPVYSFQCVACNHADMEFASMANATPVGETIECPKCRAHEYTRLVDYVHSDLKEFHTPIQMLSVACNSWEEIRQIQTKCPDAEISDDPDDELFGVPIARSRKAKMQILAATEFVEKN